MAYKWEYTPGILASVTVEGRGDNHRSGLNSKASSPQISLLRLAQKTPRRINVPAGTKISLMEVPSVQVMGSERGSVTSLLALRVCEQDDLLLVSQYILAVECSNRRVTENIVLHISFEMSSDSP